MKKLKRLTIIFSLLIVLFGSLSINAFAASYSFGGITARQASQELVDVTCNYYSLKKDGFTVKNNGTVNMYVYKNGCYSAMIRPGQTYTSSKTHSFKDRVQVYAVTRGNGKQNIYVTSTSGVIYKN